MFSLVFKAVEFLYRIAKIKFSLLNIFIIGHSHSIDDLSPVFVAPVENLTVTQGRDVQFTCIVDDLGSYKVSNFKDFQ